MKNVKAYVRTTLTAGLILAAAVLGGCSKSDAGSSAAASSGTESAASADASNSNKKELKYGKAAGPYTVLFEDAIKPILEKEGYEVLTEVDFSDLLQNDLALNDGEIDFNVEQHTAYAENFNEAQKGNLVTISPIPTVPAAIFSATETSLDAIHDGAKVAVPDDATNTARALMFFLQAGWITLNPDVGSLHYHPGRHHGKPLQHRIYRNELHQYSSCFR